MTDLAATAALIDFHFRAFGISVFTRTERVEGIDYVAFETTSGKAWAHINHGLIRGGKGLMGGTLHEALNAMAHEAATWRRAA